jgi:hypothetical protein
MAYQESNSVEYTETRRPMRLAFGRQGIATNLDRLGFEVPEKIAAMAASSTAKLGTSGLSVDLYELDQAMNKFAIKPQERIRFKIELRNEGLLE